MTRASDITEEDLTDAQIEILEMIREDPSATQKEFAEKLDVTPAAIGSRVRNIPGMNWMNRREFIHEFFDGGDETSNDGSGHQEHPANAEEVDELTSRVSDVEKRLEELDEKVGEMEDEGSNSVISDPELIRKLVLNLSNSDQFTDEEEDRLLDALIG